MSLFERATLYVTLVQFSAEIKTQSNNPLDQQENEYDAGAVRLLKIAKQRGEEEMFLKMVKVIGGF